jgi:ferric-dicitrate binding protein FerR (iron transport regulator)
MSDVTPREGQESVLEVTLRACGRRPMPSAEGTARAHARAQVEWQRLLAVKAQRRRAARLRWAGGLIAASAALAAIVVVSTWRYPAPDPSTTVSKVQGAVYGSVASSKAVVMHEGDAVRVGYRIQTATNGRMALQLPGGGSLRLDRESRIALTAANEFRLEAGRVYVDSGVLPGKPALRVATPLGVLTDNGTQFQVAWLGTRLQVQVREGSVGVLAPDLFPEHRTVMASELASLGTDGKWSRAHAESYGPAWAWITDLSTYPVAGEQRLEPILNWICRELGCRLRFRGSLTPDSVRAVTLDGSIEGLTPQQALDVIERVTTFRYRLESGELTIERADEPD